MRREDPFDQVDLHTWSNRTGKERILSEDKISRIPLSNIHSGNRLRRETVGSKLGG